MSKVTLMDLERLDTAIAEFMGWYGEEDPNDGPPPYDEYVYHLEIKWDPETQADLDLHDMLWPTYYGCPKDPGYFA